MYFFIFACDIVGLCNGRRERLSRWYHRHLHAMFSSLLIPFFLRHDDVRSCTDHMGRRQRLRSPPQQCPRAPQHKQGHHHMKRTSECEEQYGRLAMNYPLPDYEPNTTLDHSAPAHNPPKPLSRRSSLCSQTSSGNAPTISLPTSKSRGDHAASVRIPRLNTQQHAESDAHGNVYHSQRERTAPTERIRSERPDAFALLRWNKRKTSRDKTSSRDRQFAG